MDSARGQDASGPPRGAPRGVSVQEFAAARALEIKALHTVLKESPVSRSEAVPRHLRRRTTSHNRRQSTFWTKKLRMGKTVRDRKQPMEGKGDEGEDTQMKPPSRRVRRRLELKGDPGGGGGKSRDGTQRLVTHVWHAKRLKMKKLWGHWLAEGFTGRGKGSRAVIKWTKECALLHDASYYSPIELEGAAGDILHVLSAVLDPPPLGLQDVMKSEEFSGARYGNAVLHQPGRAPHGTVGPVQYMWRPTCPATPSGDCGEEKVSEALAVARQLWIWVHPAAQEESLESLQGACKFQGGLVNCRSRSGEFGRLDVLGAGSLQVIKKVLHPYLRSPSPSGNCEEKSQDSLQLGIPGIEACPKDISQSSNTVSVELFAEADSSLPGRSILAMNVYDPRDAPDKQAKYLPRPYSIISNPSMENQDSGMEEEDCRDLTKAGADSQVTKLIAETDCVAHHWWHPLQQSATRETEPCTWEHPLTEKGLSAKRHQQRLCLYDPSKSGQRNETVQSGGSSGCSVLLLRHEDRSTSACGWSIIMPISWVRAFWVPLVFAGGHVIGLRELRWLMTDAGLPSFPFDYPDSKAYDQYMHEKTALELEDNNKRPPGKRKPLCASSSWGFQYGKQTVATADFSSCEPKVQVDLDCSAADTDIHSLVVDGSTNSEGCVVDAEYPKFAGNESIEPLMAVSGTRSSQQMKAPDQAPEGDGPVSTIATVETRTEVPAQVLHTCSTSSIENHLTSFVARSLAAITQALAVEGMLHLQAGFDANAVSGATYSTMKKGDSCFVRVLIRAPRKGLIEEGALVCLPAAEDTDAWFSRLIQWQGHHLEGHDKKRKKKEESEQSEAEPTAGGGQRKRRKPASSGFSSAEKPAQAVEPESRPSLESREPIGFVTSSEVRGSNPAKAVAFCELVKMRSAQDSDRRWDNTEEIFLLVRNPRSDVYRPALATVVAD